MNQATSIVLPTHERAHVLERTLSSYVRQSGICEIILVDDGGSPPNAARLARIAASHPNVRILRNPQRLGSPTSRMTGVAAAQGDWVLFGEDDVILHEGYAATLLAHMRRLGAPISAGAVLYLQSTEDPVAALARYHQQAPSEAVALDDTVSYNFSRRVASDIFTPFLSALMLVEKSVFQTLQFDISYTGNAYREETDFTLRAERAGLRSILCPHATAFHLPRLQALGGGQHRRGNLWYETSALLNNWRFLQRHGDYLRERHGVVGSNLRLSSRFLMGRLMPIVRARLRRLLPRR